MMMKKLTDILRYVAAGFISLLAPTAFAQNGHKVDVSPDIVYTIEANRYLIGGIVVDGIQGYDQESLQATSGLEIGQEIAVPGEEISAAVRRYWQQGLFSNVQIAVDSIVDNRLVYLHIHLTARPRISSINYTGIKKSEREDLEEMVGLRVGNQITPDMVDRAKLIIKRHFEEKDIATWPSTSYNAMTSRAITVSCSTSISRRIRRSR